MASFDVLDSGKIRAFVCVNGRRATKTLLTKREAKAWAAAKEAELHHEDATPLGDRHTLREAFNRYANEVSPKKRGWRWEMVRLEAFMRDAGFPLDEPISGLTARHLAGWRDSRLGHAKRAVV